MPKTGRSLSKKRKPLVDRLFDRVSPLRKRFCAKTEKTPSRRIIIGGQKMIEKQPETSISEKRKFPIGAVFLIIYHLLLIITKATGYFGYFPSILSNYFSSPFNVIAIVLEIGLAVVLFLNLKDIVKLSLIGADFLMKIIVFVYFQSWKDTPLWVVSRVFRILTFVPIVMLLLCSMDVGALKEHKKKFSIALFVFFGLSTLFSLLYYSVDGRLFLHIANQSDLLLLDIPDFVTTLLFLISLLLIGFYVANPYKTIKVGADGEALGGAESEFYVPIGKHVCLLLFTFGIWLYIWIYKMTAFTNRAKGEEERNPTNKLLLCIFVPFYSIYWTYKTALRIDAIAKEKGVSSDLGTICLVLAIFVPIVSPILLQDKANAILSAEANTAL